jgi:hypothetical protein
MDKVTMIDRVVASPSSMKRHKRRQQNLKTGTLLVATTSMWRFTNPGLVISIEIGDLCIVLGTDHDDNLRSRRDAKLIWVLTQRSDILRTDPYNFSEVA